MEFTITLGTLRNGVYEEASRFTIQIQKNDPMIAEIIQAIPENSLPPYMAQKKEYFYLVDSKTQKSLDPMKRVSDYDLHPGDQLRLMSAVR